MGTNQNIHLALFQILQNALLLLGATKTIQHFHSNTKITHTLLKGQEMLLGQNSGGHQHCHLLAIYYSLEGSANGHLGFAIAHITAQQALHGLGLLHVGLDFSNGLKLVRCFLIGKGFFKLPLQLRVGAKGMAGHYLSLCIKPQ